MSRAVHGEIRLHPTRCRGSGADEEFGWHALLKRTGTADLEAHPAPLFSVIVPLYNKQAYVAATLESVLAQTAQDYEIIVVDDGSTDASVTQLAPYRDRLTLVEQENRGPGLARNRAADAARGQWLAFLDADDLWMPDHLDTLRGLILSHPGCDVVASAFDHFWNGVRIRRDMHARPRSSGLADYFEELYGGASLFTSSTAVRAGMFKRLGGFGPEWPGEDSELWIRLALLGPFAVSATVTARYMQTREGLMGQGTRSAGNSDDARQTPTMRTLDRAIGDELEPVRRRMLKVFKDRMLLSAARVAIADGRRRRAATYLRSIERHDLASLAYLGLAACPRPVLQIVRSCLTRPA